MLSFDPRSALLAGVFQDVLTDSGPKFTQMVAALVGFFGVLILVLLLAARARGRAQTPLAIVIFVAPAVILLLLGLILPAIRTIVLSLYSDDVPATFVGGSNYAWIFSTSDERAILLRTIVWIIVAPLASTALGLLLALLIDRMKRESVPKSLIFLPMAISFVGASIIWSFVYAYRDPSQPQIGLLSQVAIWLGWSNPPNWLLSSPLNNFLLMVIMIWIQTGFAMVVLSAAIKAIPGDVMEAAALDGAHGWRLFRAVTVPMIRGTLVVVVTTIMIATLKIFDIVRTTTGGNFDTQVLANEMYNQAFTQFSVGRGSALAVVLFVGVIPLMIYNIRQLRKDRQ